jgi:hypothetical protein
MNAPDRSAEVRVLCAAHPEAFGPPDETNDARRLALLRTWIVPALNQLDGGRWGLLTKPEQNNRVICDCIVWADTREHFDIVTGTGPCWIPHGPMNANWVWTPVASPAPTPAPIAPVVPASPDPIPPVVVAPALVVAPPAAIMEPELPAPALSGLAGIASAVGSWLGQNAALLLLSWWSARKATPKPGNPVSGAIPRPPALTRTSLPK